MYWNKCAELIKANNMELNSNIRCIEILCKNAIYMCKHCWIVTLDVLKFSIPLTIASVARVE